MFRLRSCWLCLLAALSFPAVAAPLNSRALDAVPLHVLPAEALDRVRASLPPATNRGPQRLAVSVPMTLGLTDGVWSEEAGESVWRARLYSAGATLLIARLDRLELPAGAALTLRDVAGTTVQGPYTAEDVDADGALWTAMVPGEEALLELRVPISQRDEADLHLDTLGHGEFELRNDGVSPKSGGCNVDVVCPQGDAWRNQIRSAVRLQIPSSPGQVVLCSGQLVNNTAQDDTPYALTATHCGITSGNASGVVAYFNFQTSSCNGTPNGTLTQNQNGATRVFANARSDHTLILLSSAPSAAYNAYLSGFDASTGATPSSGVSIHHPSGDEKRISTFGAPASRNNGVCLGQLDLVGVCLGTVIDTFRVRWSSGVTEPGSSGGGLWNQSQRLVGVLSGGSSGCSNPGGDDFFGRMDVAWSNGLSAFLDPASTGARSIGGRDATTTSTPSGGTTTGGGTTTTNNSNTGSSGGGGGGAFGHAFVLLLAGLLRLRFRSPT